jgi:hypothetical protein
MGSINSTNVYGTLLADNHLTKKVERNVLSFVFKGLFKEKF